MTQRTFKVRAISRTKLVDNPLQPAGRIDKSQLVAIKASLEKDGLVSPPSVAPVKGRHGYYMLADGTRRVNAFEGDTITCLVYQDEPGSLFAVLNGARKHIAANGWLSAYANAPDEESRGSLLTAMPRNPKKWIQELEVMVGRDYVVELG